MTVLITGAGGFIGLNVAELLLSRGDKVVGLALAPLHAAAAASFATLRGELIVETGDVCDFGFVRDVFDRHKVRRVLHTAAITAGPTADPARATRVLDVNVIGTQAVLQAAREAKAARVVLTSSGAVYGEAPFGTEPVTEDTAPLPQTLYAISKLAAERLAHQYRVAHGLDVVRTRLTAIYGPWEHDTGVRDTLSPPLQIATAAARGESVILAAGGQRDWTLSADIARGLVALLEAPRTEHDLYNLGCGATWHPELLCRALATELPGLDWHIAGPGEAPSIAYNDALDRPRRSPPSSARFVQEFGDVFGSPADSAAAYAKWVREHPAAISA